MSDSSFLYEQVAGTVSDMIRSGSLSPGGRAPSLRALGRQLGVSIATVTQAYALLEERGYLKARPQSGYYVLTPHGPPVPATANANSVVSARPVRFGRHMNEILASADRANVLALSIANPDPCLLPAKALNRALKRATTHAATSLVPYAPIAGIKTLRQQIARRGSTRGHSVTPDDILITNGATEALSLCLRAVARPGDVIAVESPTYFSLLQLIKSLGMLALEIHTDAQTGLTAETLEPLLRREQVRAVISVGNFNNPTGSLVPADMKRDIVALLARHQIPLIEDDVYGDIHFDEQRPLPYQAFDTHGLVLYCSSFSKTVAPGYRLGWIQTGDRQRQLLDLKLIASSASAGITQYALADFLARGSYDRHLKRLRRACRQQVLCTRQAIHRYFPAGTRVSEPRGGYAIWVQCPRGTDSHEVYRRAIERDISIAPGPLFSAAGGYRRFMRICAGLPWSAEVDEALAVLGALVSDSCGRERQA